MVLSCNHSRRIRSLRLAWAAYHPAPPKNETKAGEMAQLVKYLLLKNEDLRSIPSIQVNKEKKEINK